MPLDVAVLLIIGAVIIAAAAIGLIRVIWHLIATVETLEGVIGGVGLVATRTTPVAPVLASVNANLKPVRDFCEGI